MHAELSLLIDGEWIGANQRSTKAVVNPATLETLGQLPMATAPDLDRALESAARAFATWRKSSVEERSGVLRRAANILRSRAEGIARIATMEEGKPLAEMRVEVAVGAGLLDFYAEECRRVYGRVLVRPTGTRSLVVKEPVGPIAAFSPWNFPVGNPVRKLAAPVAAGCSVILKPAEEAPGSALMVAKALIEAGLPPGVVQIVFGDPDVVSRHLLASDVIRQVSFTGSTAVGKHLMALAAQNAQRTTMELGGHAPVIVFDDADIERAVEILSAAKFRNAGQVCVSPTRFYVQQGVHDRFTALFKQRMERIVVGNGQADGTQMGPLAHDRRPNAVQALVDDAVAQGARLRLGGERLAKAGHFYAPTLLTEVPTNARIMNEEPFGPVVITQPFETFDEVVHLANRLPFGLAAFAFTQSAKQSMLIGDALEAGMVAINGTGIAAADAPFGGVKQSGHGAEDGPEGLAECYVTKSIHQY